MAPPPSGPQASRSTTEPWVSIDDVAGHLGVRRDSVYRWIEQRGLPATKIGKLWKLKLSEVDVWMRDRRPGRRPAGTPAAPLPSLAGPVARPTILVIDDEQLVRDTVAEFLTDEGYAVVLAADGAEALERLAAATALPALIVLDLKMPNLDGGTFRTAQTRDPGLAAIPVVVVTATPGAEVPGAVIVRKPLRLPQLAAAIEGALASRTEVAR